MPVHNVALKIKKKSHKRLLSCFKKTGMKSFAVLISSQIFLFVHSNVWATFPLTVRISCVPKITNDWENAGKSSATSNFYLLFVAIFKKEIFYRKFCMRCFACLNIKKYKNKSKEASEWKFSIFLFRILSWRKVGNPKTDFCCSSEVKCSVDLWKKIRIMCCFLCVTVLERRRQFCL